jgi:uncharacterized protein (DUF2336 family)
VQAASALLLDVENHVRNGSESQRVQTLRRVTDLFLQGANNFVEDHVALFDEVLGCLIDNIETKALERLSGELAPVENAPVNVVRKLSLHDEILIARPVLAHSRRLTDRDLEEIALTKSQAHLLAIAGRSELSPVVTDVLVDRGNNAVAERTAGNNGASFSSHGYLRLVERAEQNENIAERVAKRTDLSPALFKQLVTRATGTVLDRLLRNADPEMKRKMQEALPEASKEIEQLAEQAIEDMHQSIGELATLANLPVALVERLVREKNIEALLIVCKAARLGWPATRDMLAKLGFIAISGDPEFRSDRANFLQISSDTAQRVVRFIRARGSLGDGDLGRMMGQKHSA